MAGSLKDLAAYRFERAVEELTNAKDLLDAGKYKLSMNRSYYAVFHAMRSVNTLDGFDSSKHSGVIAHFNQYHVKNGDFPKDISKRIGQALSMREHADYEDFFVASQKEAQQQAEFAGQFLQQVKKYLEGKGVLGE